MSDNKLKCILAFRLAGTVPLAKYDHGSGSSGDYSDAVGAVIKSDPPSEVNDSSKIGGFKVVQSDIHQIIYGADNEGICLAVVVGTKYASRVAIQLLMDIYPQFMDKCASQAKSGTTNSLSKKAKSIFQPMAQKYEDPTKVDKASSLIDKVDQVKSTMSDNIAVMLKNTENAETIAQQSEQLSEQATVFKKKSGDLKKQMWWKNMKMTLILVAVVVGIILIIVVPMFVKN